VVDVGDTPAPGGIDKRTLLVGAVLLGGAIGAFMLVNRRMSASDTSENKAQTDVPVNNMAYQNLAEQLLGFRGDVSVANANLASQQQDLLSAMGAESASRMRDSNLLQASIWQTFIRATNPNVSWDFLMNQNPYLPHDPHHPYTIPIPTDPTTEEGAGGATPRDAILAAFGAEDDSSYYLAHMSSGPVRQLTNRTY
jgi:hypothetical protein